MMNLNIFGQSVFSTAMEVYKKPIVIQISEPLTEETHVNSLENPNLFAPAGFRIVTGVKGEKYPLPPKDFENYEAVEGGYAKKKIIVRAVQLSQEGQVSTPWGETLHAQIGDYLVMEAEDNMWVVEKNIFEETYVIS